MCVFVPISDYLENKHFYLSLFFQFPTFAHTNTHKNRHAAGREVRPLNADQIFDLRSICKKKSAKKSHTRHAVLPRIYKNIITRSVLHFFAGQDRVSSLVTRN